MKLSIVLVSLFIILFKYEVSSCSGEFVLIIMFRSV